MSESSASSILSLGDSGGDDISALSEEVGEGVLVALEAEVSDENGGRVFSDLTLLSLTVSWWSLASLLSGFDPDLSSHMLGSVGLSGSLLLSFFGFESDESDSLRSSIKVLQEVNRVDFSEGGEEFSDDLFISIEAQSLDDNLIGLSGSSLGFLLLLLLLGGLLWLLLLNWLLDWDFLFGVIIIRILSNWLLGLLDWLLGVVNGSLLGWLLFLLGFLGDHWDFIIRIIIRILDNWLLSWDLFSLLGSLSLDDWGIAIIIRILDDWLLDSLDGFFDWNDWGIRIIRILNDWLDWFSVVSLNLLVNLGHFWYCFLFFLKT